VDVAAEVIATKIVNTRCVALESGPKEELDRTVYDREIGCSARIYLYPPVNTCYRLPNITGQFGMSTCTTAAGSNRQVEQMRAGKTTRQVNNPSVGSQAILSCLPADDLSRKPSSVGLAFSLCD
jgi:hypothetical protein